MDDDTEATATNTSPDLWAEAMETYERDTGDLDRKQELVRLARKRRTANLKVFAERGIPSSHVVARYEESVMTEDERHQLYAIEAGSRRALDLWSARTPEDFNQLLERAVSTPPASQDSLDKMAGERCYNDAYNSVKHGGLTEQDNPHIQGTLKYVRWDAGCRRAMNEMRILELRPMADGSVSAVTAQEHNVETIADEVEKELAAKASRSSPRKNARKRYASIAEDIPAFKDDAPSAEGLFPETPSVPV